MYDYNIETLAIRFAMVKRITIMTKISNGLLDQVTDRNTRPSVNYANIWLDHLFLFPWYMYIRPVHKNFFLEFPKMQGSFELNFDK